MCDDEVKNEWSCTSTPTIVFMIYYLTTDGDYAAFSILEYIFRCRQDNGLGYEPSTGQATNIKGHHRAVHFRPRALLRLCTSRRQSAPYRRGFQAAG